MKQQLESDDQQIIHSRPTDTNNEGKKGKTYNTISGYLNKSLIYEKKSGWISCIK